MVTTNEQPIDLAAVRMKYRDYRVEIHESRRGVRIEIDHGNAFRFPVAIERRPADKLFVVYVRTGATDRDWRMAKAVATSLPQGEWARFPDTWCRRRRNGRWVYRQGRGEAIDDPLIDLELELMLDGALTHL